MTATPRDLGLRQTALAARLGVRATTVSDNARGVSGKVNPMWRPLMDALEIMTPEQRAAWVGSPGPIPG